MAAPYEYDPVVLLDSNGVPKPGGAVKAYPPETTNFTGATPVTLTNLSGQALENNELVAGDYGVTSGWRVTEDYTRVALYAPGLPVIIASSVKGIDEKASAALAQASSSAALVTDFLANPPQGSGGTTTVDGLTDATAVGKSVVKAPDATTARAAIGAGTSHLVLGTGLASAASGAEVLYKNATTRGAATPPQTIVPKVTFVEPPVVPVDSFTQDRIVGALARFEALENRRAIVVVDTVNSPLPAGTRTNDIVFTRTAPPTDEGGGVVNPPPTITTYRRLLLAGVANGSTLTVAGGTGDTPLDSIVGTAPTVTVNSDGVREVVIPANSTAGPTWRWTSTAPGTFAPATAAFSFAFGIRVLAYPTGVTTFVSMGNVLQFTQTIAGNINLTTSTGTFVAQSPAIPIDGIYTIKGWRSTTGNTEVRIYAPDGSTFWTQSRDLATAIPSSFILGRTGVAGGSLAFSNMRFHNVTGELAG